MRHRYPAECPVFEVVQADDYDAERGVFAGMHFEGFVCEAGFAFSDGIVDGMAYKQSACGHPFHYGQIRPLTRAAREMLAIAKAGGR